MVLRKSRRQCPSKVTPGISLEGGSPVSLVLTSDRLRCFFIAEGSRPTCHAQNMSWAKSLVHIANMGSREVPRPGGGTYFGVGVPISSIIVTEGSPQPAV